MEAGDSVLVDSMRTARCVWMSLRTIGYKGAIRKMDDGFRVWRVA